MNDDTENSRRFDLARYAVDVCDTEYCSGNQKFSVFRDTIANTGMAWRFEIASEIEFDARIISLKLGSGLVHRANMSPLVGTRTSLEIANSTIDGFYVCYIISGEALVEQDGRAVVGASRGVMVFDGSSPVRVLERSSGSYDVLSMIVPKAYFESLHDVDSLFRNISISAERMTEPLSTCLRSLSIMLPSAPGDELMALYEASLALLPTAVGRSKEELTEKVELRPNRHVRELLKFVNDNIGNAELAPQSAAKHIGMSVRYVHRQFAINGTTFGAYVMAKRLECIRRDLISDTHKDLPIFALAFRWGFKDLSTFIRAFKKRFGCTPRQYRLRG